MALIISETFGFAVQDRSEAAQAQRRSEICPFSQKLCWKRFRSGGRINGVCAGKQTNSDEVIICPDRLYAESFKILEEIVDIAFGTGMKLIPSSEVASTQGQANRIVAFGKHWGKELRVPKNDSDAKDYSADWILAKISADGTLEEFVPVEVQSIDTTGSYQKQWYALEGLELPASPQPTTTPGLNWENVNKRIIPQLLAKGNIFGGENLCRKGLFFVCPSGVYKRLLERLGAGLSARPMNPGTLTFRWYDLEAAGTPGQIRKLALKGQFTTTVQNFRDAYNSTLKLPSIDAMQRRISKALEEASEPRKKRS